MDDLRKKVDFKLKKYYIKEAQRASEKVDMFIKMINDEPILNEKSEIMDKLRKMYYVKKLCYLHKIDNNLKANEKIEINLLDREINELEKKLRDQPKKGSSVFTLQKEFAKLLTFLVQLHAGNNSKKLKNDINRLLKALYNSKQISKLVYENLIAAI